MKGSDDVVGFVNKGMVDKAYPDSSYKGHCSNDRIKCGKLNPVAFARADFKG